MTRKLFTLHAALPKVSLALAAAATCVMVPSVIYAQASGEVSGTVVDSTGAVLPASSVTITNTGTNSARTVKTTSAGAYAFTNLEPGTYKVSAASAGFETYEVTVVVNVGGRYTIDPKLPVGSSNTTVEVAAGETAVVNTSSPEISQVISQAQITQLPSLTRNPYDFVALSGNVSNGDASASNGLNQNNQTHGVGFGLNGARTSGTEILLDGVENIGVFSDAVGVPVLLDAVQEYRIITNNFSPEYGRASGGVVSVATVAGTNAIHGRAWEYNRISATTANTVANAQNSVERGKYVRNQFGGIVNGPIIKDKLFFSGATEFTRVRSSASQVASVVAPEFIAVAPANVQAFYTAFAGTPTYNVLSTTTNAEAGGPTGANTTTGLLYNNLPGSLPVFNKVSYTVPSDAGGGLPQNTYNIFGRVDYNYGPKTQVFFRYVNYNETDFLGAASYSAYSQYNTGGANKATAYLLSAAHEFNASLSTLGRLSFSRTAQPTTFNAAYLNVPTISFAAAKDPVTHQSLQAPGSTGTKPFGGPQNTIQYNQDVNYLRGKHQFQAGGQVLYIQENIQFGAYAQAIEQFGSNASNSLKALDTGNIAVFTAAVDPHGATPCARNPYTRVLTQTAACTITLPATAPSFARSDRFHDWAVYGQDQYKLTPTLTVNYGLRYEYYGVQHNNNQNLDSNFYYGSGSSTPAQVRSGSVLTTPNSPIRKLWNPSYGTVSPRVGFAFDVFGNGKTSLRGGYGISYERNFGNVTFNVIQNPPNYAVVVLTSTAAQQYTVTNSNSGPLVGTGSVPLPPTSLRHVDQDIKTAQTQFHSLSIDQQIGRGTFVSLSYNGARGIHLYDIKNYNINGMGNLYLGDPITDPVSGKQALTFNNPKFSNDNNRGSNGDSYYNAVNVQFTTNDIHHTGLSVVANYTYAHSLDDLSSTFSDSGVGNNIGGLGYMNSFAPALDHGNSDFDIKHRIVIAPIYRTPTFFKDKGGYFAQLVSGFEITGIFTARTGTPFTITDSTNIYNGSLYGLVRYNPSSPTFQHHFKSIPNGTDSNGNQYVISGASTLPVDSPFGNPALAIGDYTGGVADLGPYPSTMTARNDFRGPGAYNINASVSKTFPIYERVNLELRAEAFDLTNHHNLYIQESLLDAANYSAGAGTYGPGGENPQIIASKGGVGGVADERRFLQFAGKINF